MSFEEKLPYFLNVNTIFGIPLLITYGLSDTRDPLMLFVGLLMLHDGLLRMDIDILKDEVDHIGSELGTHSDMLLKRKER